MRARARRSSRSCSCSSAAALVGRRVRRDRPRRHGGRGLARSRAGRAALLAMMLIYAVVYFAAPNVEIRRFQCITPGAVVRRRGVAARLGRRSSSTCRTSRPTGPPTARSPAAVILLVWLWLTNVVLLFGAELNAVDRPAALAGAARDLRRAAAAREGARGRLAETPLGVDGVRRSGAACAPRMRAQRAAARAVAAQLAVRRVGDRVALRRARRGRAEQRRSASAGASAAVNAAVDRLAGALEEAVGDLDARRAVAQRGERVDACAGSRSRARRRRPASAPLQAVGLVVDDQRAAVGLGGEHVDEAVDERAAAGRLERERERRLAADAARGRRAARTAASAANAATSAADVLDLGRR